jgi:hypothetical protein
MNDKRIADLREQAANELGLLPGEVTSTLRYSDWLEAELIRVRKHRDELIVARRALESRVGALTVHRLHSRIGKEAARHADPR